MSRYPLCLQFYSLSITGAWLVLVCSGFFKKQQTNEFNATKIFNEYPKQSEFIICKFCFENEISKKHLERFHYVTTRIRTCLHFHAIFPRPLCDGKVQDSPSLSQLREAGVQTGNQADEWKCNRGRNSWGGVKDFWIAISTTKSGNKSLQILFNYSPKGRWIVVDI